MGFGIKQLRDSSAEKAKVDVAEARAMESASEDMDAPASTSPVAAPSAAAPARPNAFARPTVNSLSGAPGSPATPPARPNAFARPTVNNLGSAPSSPAAPPARPSFASTSSTPSPAAAPPAPARPSFGAQAPAPAAPAPAPSRPAFAPSSSLPQVRGAFVRDPSKMGSAPVSNGSDASPVSQMTPQALFEIVCTHRKLSEQAIEAAKSQARNNPDAVMAQMRRIYDQEIAPNRTRHTSDLPSARAQHTGKVVFLLRKDDKERIRVMSKEDAVATGEILLDGATVENIHAAASPFVAPSRLFTEPSVDANAIAQGQATNAKADTVASQPEPVQAQMPIAHRSPKP